MVITIKNEKKRYKANLELIREMEASHIDDPEFQVADQHAREIADQKLMEMETAKTDKSEESKSRGGFQLRTGYTKEDRDAYQGGTPMKRD